MKLHERENGKLIGHNPSKSGTANKPLWISTNDGQILMGTVLNMTIVSTVFMMINNYKVLLV